MTRKLKIPFRLNDKMVVIIKRALELGILTLVVLIPVVWVHGEFDLLLLKADKLSTSLNEIGILLILRLVVGRHVNGLLAVGSATLAFLAFLYATEAALWISDQRKLTAHQKEMVIQTAGQSQHIVASEKSGDRQSPASHKNATDSRGTTVENPLENSRIAADDGESNRYGKHFNDAFESKKQLDRKTVDIGMNDGHNWTWGHRVVYNAFGFREREIVVPKPVGVFRIMVLGDSLTWGAGLALEERYSNLLEKKLRQTLNDGQIEVLNFGLPGGPTVTERNILKKYQDQIDPDLIIVGFCLNDTQPRSQNYSVERARLDDLYNMIASLRHIGLKRTYAFIIDRCDNLFASMGKIPTWTEALDRTYQKESAEWKAFEKALTDIKKISDSRSLPPPILVLLIQLVAKDHPFDPYITRWFHQVGETAGAIGFIVVNPEQAFINELYLKDIPVNPKDGHPSVKCNWIYAKEMFDTVLETLAHP